MPSTSLRLSMATNYSLRRTCPPGTRISSVRRSRYHRPAALGYAYKDDQDRESLNPRSTEYSKSGSDDEAAGHGEAFNPNTTRPEEEKSGSGGKDPLEVSPANKESSKSKEGGGATKAPQEDRERTSKTGGANKAGGRQSG